MTQGAQVPPSSVDWFSCPYHCLEKLRGLTEQIPALSG